MTQSLSELAASTRTEIEARAIQPPYKFAQRTIFASTPDGRDNLFWAHFQSATTGGATEQQLIDTAAFFYTAGMAYHPLVETVEECRKWIIAEGPALSGDETKAWLAIMAKIDAALLAAKGKQHGQ
jgi:hypothetical protein